MLEAVIALAVLSLLALLALEPAAAAVDRMAVHAAFQDLETGLVRLRAEAFAAEAPVEVTAERAGLPAGWSLRTAAPLVIGADGACPAGELELWRDGRLRARLVPSGAPCRYLRAV